MMAALGEIINCLKWSTCVFNISILSSLPAKALTFFLKNIHKVWKFVFLFLYKNRKSSKKWEKKIKIERKFVSRSIPFINQQKNRLLLIVCVVTQQRIFSFIIKDFSTWKTNDIDQSQFLCPRKISHFLIFLSIFQSTAVDNDDSDFRFRYLLIISIITHRIKCMYVLELGTTATRRWNDDRDDEKSVCAMERDLRYQVFVKRYK